MANIPTPIFDDEFANSLKSVVKKYKPRTVIDVGASNGGGSTRVFYELGLKVYALEIREDFSKDLKARYSEDDKVIVVNAPASNGIIPESEVWRLYRKFPRWTCWKVLGIHEMVKWRNNQESLIQGFDESKKNGIEYVKQRYRIKKFGMALLDGSPFTGMADLDAVYGAKIIALDDVRDIKNYETHRRLSRDECYEMVDMDMNYRNGYSIFVKTCK